MVGWELQLGDLGSLGGACWISTGVAILIGLAGIAISLYFYRKSRRVKQLCYTVTTANLIQDYSAKLSGLKIEYKGKNPANISVSKIAIWNDGTETIDHTEVLDWSVISFTTPANQFGLARSGSLLSDVVFDYLDKTEGGIVQLVHTAKTSASILLSGRVKGSGYAVRREFGPNITLSKISSRMTAVGLPGLLLTALAYQNTRGYFQDAFGATIWITIVLLLGGFVLSMLARRFRMVPKHF